MNRYDADRIKLAKQYALVMTDLRFIESFEFDGVKLVHFDRSELLGVLSVIAQHSRLGSPYSVHVQVMPEMPSFRSYMGEKNVTPSTTVETKDKK